MATTPPISKNQPNKILNLIFLIIVFSFIIYFAVSMGQDAKRIKYSAFQEMVLAGEVSDVYVRGNSVRFRLAEDSKVTNRDDFPNKYDNYAKTASPSAVIEWLSDEARLTQINIALNAGNTGDPIVFTFDSEEASQSLLSTLIPYLLMLGVTVIMFVVLMRAMSKGNSSAMNFGRSRAKLGNNSKVTFADVAGADEEKEELKEVVEFLKDPQKFVKLGARIPKGFLMVGPPGTGKTLLAKAVAGESNVPFFSITGSDFVEMFVGVGASRVRDLFVQAKAAAPCIVFIDEIDAVGRQRGAGLGGGNDEREQTLNQLLTQMDGFETNSGIVVMAATNRADVLDPALLRPGRFDRQVYVYPPDVKGRESILKVHARNKPLAKNVDLKQLARLTTGFTGADIELLLNEAAILAARSNKVVIEMKELGEAVNKVLLGPQKKSRIVTERDKKITAYHEAGHAIVAKKLLSGDEVQEVSIIPRGSAAGYTLHRPDTDDSFVTESKLKAELAVSMGGRAAEILTIKDVTTGAVSDIQNATKIATRMVTEWGMSSLGPINYGKGSEVFLGRDYTTKQTYSDKIAADIDAEVKKFIDAALNKAIEILRQNSSIMEEMTKLLLERETILSEEIAMLMDGKTANEIKTFLEKRDIEHKEKLTEENKKIAQEFETERKRKEELERAKKAAQFLNATGLMQVELREKPEQENSGSKEDSLKGLFNTQAETELQQKVPDKSTKTKKQGTANKKTAAKKANKLHEKGDDK